MALIDIRGLGIGFDAGAGLVKVLRDIDLSVARGQSVGLVGESGSGKSTLALAAMGFLRPGLRRINGEVRFRDLDMFAQSPAALQSLRGGQLGLVPQNAGQSLTPTSRIGQQMIEALRLHSDLPPARRPARAMELLAQVRLPDPEGLMRRYPHELSGGQQQRVAIAMALAGGPEALLLDEPTTGLDVTTQAHILTLLRDLARDHDMAMLYVSHDLGVIAQVCDRVAVMKSGEIVLQGPVHEVLGAPDHPYARALLEAVPRLHAPRSTPPRTTPPHAASAAKAEAALSAEGLTLCYARRTWLDALRQTPARPPTVEGISLTVPKGGTLGLVGESGSGKSTILRAIAGLMAPLEGRITLAGGTTLPPRIEQRPPEMQRRTQLIFQNPDASLNPRHTVLRLLAQPLGLYEGLAGAALRRRAAELLAQVALPESYLDRLPGQLSGGEKQRVAIARAFAAAPDLVLCDEVTSALDVSVQQQVLALLAELQDARGTAFVFVSHDLAVVQAISDQVAVLYQGRLCETGPTDAVFGARGHPYTQVLLGAVLRPDPDHRPALLADDAPDPAPPAQGCPFQRRCPHHMGAICDSTPPPARRTADGHTVWCHLPEADLPQKPG